MTSFPSAAEIREPILAWYAREQRDFPWRHTRDPYGVLVSEVMLQQTQASRVAERFPHFLERFPTADALAAAPTAHVLAAWSGLGYNRRALLLQRAAAAVSRDGWPSDVAGLMRLPGIGPYTARAIASLAFGIPAGVVDTNVRRWLLRRFDLADTPSALQAAADALAAPGTGEAVAAWTHATMELGASVCRARAPHCEVCPISDGCPSRGLAVPIPVPRQAPLAGSDRAYRGAALRLLSNASGHAIAESALRSALDPIPDDERWRRVVGGLEADGLIHRCGESIGLGAGTI